jgi:hypothetical protein
MRHHHISGLGHCGVPAQDATVGKGLAGAWTGSTRAGLQGAQVVMFLQWLSGSCMRAMRKCTAPLRYKPVCVQECAHSAAKAATGAACSLLEAALAEAAACAATGAQLGGRGARGVRVQ